jgi:hypothetical protein
MNTIDALRIMVEHFPGGRPAMAARLGKTDEVLRKELSGAPTHKLGAVDACMISSLCNEANSEHCDAYATVVAAHCGGFVALDTSNGTEGGSLMASTVSLVTGASQVLADVTSARADGMVSDNERRQIEKDARAVIESMQEVLREVARENAASHIRMAS